MPHTVPDKGATVLSAGNGFEAQPRTEGDEAPERSALSQFDRLLERARIAEHGSADRRKDEFLATVCHELRSPIGAIQNAVKVLGRVGTKITVQHHMHELIERQAQQMAFLVGGLLDITRIVRGQLTLHCERVDLRTVLSNAVETLDWDLRGRRQRLSLTSPKSSV
jgi:signal transduction histidine kinase